MTKENHMNKIEKIEEVAGIAFADRYGEFDGYKITTEKDIYHLLICNFQNCCEGWGYLDTCEDSKEYIGANLLGVKLTDTGLNVAKINEEIGDLDAGGIQFVDFETDKGAFQLAVYNGHNGYYGHDILLTRNDEVILEGAL